MKDNDGDSCEPPADNSRLGPKLASVLVYSILVKAPLRQTRLQYEEICRENIQITSPCTSAALGMKRKVSCSLLPSPRLPTRALC